MQKNTSAEEVFITVVKIFSHHDNALMLPQLFIHQCCFLMFLICIINVRCDSTLCITVSLTMP